MATRPSLQSTGNPYKVSFVKAMSADTVFIGFGDGATAHFPSQWLRQQLDEAEADRAEEIGDGPAAEEDKE